MNNQMKKYVTAISLAFISLGAMAQSTHEVSVYAGGGLAGLQPKVSKVLDISDKNKMGPNFGVGYAYNISPSFALLSGVDITMYKSDMTLDAVEGNYLSVDGENDAFKFVFKGEGYKETIKATYLSIPVMVRYTYHVSPKVGVYVAGGAKVGFAMSSKYNNSLSSIVTEGAYVQWGQGEDIPTIGDIETEGFGTYENLNSSGDLSLKTKFSAAAELGVRYAISNKYAVYAGGYIDYALNNVYNGKGKEFMAYDAESPSTIVINSMAQSINKKDMQANKLVSKIAPMSIGFKLQFAFGL